MIAGNIPGKTQTASVAIYDAIQAGRDNEAFTLAVIVSLIAVVMLYFINRFGRALPCSTATAAPGRQRGSARGGAGSRCSARASPLR